MIKKRIAVAVINLSNFHKCTKDLFPGEISSIQGQMLRIVLKHAREHKGVVDTFQGDHVVLSFNAVKVAQAYCRRAVQAAYAITAEICASPSLPKARAGVAGGYAIVGNSGCPEMQRFNIVGPVYKTAWNCQSLLSDKLCKPYSGGRCKVLTTASLALHIESEFYLQHVDVISSVSSSSDQVSHELLCSVEDYVSRSKRQQLVEHIKLVQSGADGMAAACDNKKHWTMAKKTNSCHQSASSPQLTINAEDCDEWMYELQEREKQNPYASINAIWAELAKHFTKDDAHHAAQHQLNEMKRVAEEQQQRNEEQQKEIPPAAATTLPLGAHALQDLLNRFSSKELMQYDAFAHLP